MTFLVQSREAFEHNTDPQRRCYDGYHFSSEWVWAAWRSLSEHATEEAAEASAEGWRKLNHHVKNRRLEYRAILKDKS
jgi:hypothetical protein